MGNLLKLSYWFDPLPGPWLNEYLKIIYAFFGLLVVAGLVAWLLAGKNKADRLIMRFWSKVQHFALTIGLVGLVLVLIRQERIYFLSMPLWLLLLVLGAIVWAYYIFRYITRVVPERRKEIEAKKLKEKYLPR